MIQLVATCPEQIKPILAEEIRASGGKNINFDYRAVQFEVSDDDFYRIHLELRTASRIFRVIKKVPSKREIILRSQSYRIEWENYLKPTATFTVEGVQTNRGPEFMSSNAISKAVREGLQERFQNRAGQVPVVDLKSPDVKIIAYCSKDRCTISIDTAGKALHKRGYRLGNHPAPIKETLAAGLLQLAQYRGDIPLYDPMCGSGTIVIEAAMIALGKSPLIHRKKGEFGFEHLANLDRNAWRTVQEEMRLQKQSAPNAQLFASDLSREYLEQAKTNALRARVEKHIEFSEADFLATEPPSSVPGLLIFNMPYGERIGEDSSMKEFMQEIGRKLKFDYAGWRAAILVAADSPYKLLGLRPNKKIDLNNGSIPVKLLMFDLYQGKKADS